jgi:outer membrane receptor for ferrienterochelin and colicins
MIDRRGLWPFACAAKYVLTCVMCLVASGAASGAQPGQGQIRVSVRSEGVPVPDATITVGVVTGTTDPEGVVVLQVPPGTVQVRVRHPDFFDVTQDVRIVPGQSIMVEVDLVERPEVEEEVVVVASTRTGRRLEEQPTRVEVLGREEIEEKILMTPGDIVMMLNEMGGLRVQATSPALGAASVRVQGMKGRYTRFFSDGLPLFGQQVGGLGLLQIPPMDLGQVEVIKGVASAFYGAGAMGGVVNLLSRRPMANPIVETLFNVSSLGATDGVVFVSSPASGAWSASLLAGGHGQRQNDRDNDGWVDVAGYARGVVRPRVFWEHGNGRSAFMTAGVTVESRTGGTAEGAGLPATGESFVESLDTRRYDLGGVLQTPLLNRYVMTARAAVAWQRHDHALGPVLERARQDTVFGEVAMRGAAGMTTWVAGVAYERDDYDPLDVPWFAYAYDVPGVFGQVDLQLTPGIAMSAGARVDVHSEYGTFVSPRVSALFRRDEWVGRVSVGRGFFGPTPLTEETEAAGLARLAVPHALEAERGTSVSVDLTRTVGAGSVTATFFGSRIADPVAVDREEVYRLFNRSEATTNLGVELLATLRRGPFVATSSYTYVRSREGDASNRQDAELTPRHSAGLVTMWESDGKGRVGTEVYYTGRQRLEVNPYRRESRPYVIVGFLAERRLGRFRVFINAENVTDVRQTRWDQLLRPTQGVDGRWTVDAWAPLDGRAFNGGVRVDF